LRDAIPVPQVDEHQRALVAVRIDPAVQDNLFASVFFPQLATSMSSAQSHHEKFLEWEVKKLLGRL
jgi:hypothetical protein